MAASTQIAKWGNSPFEVSLPPGGAIVGVVLADHVKSLDWQARQVVFEAPGQRD